MQPANVAAGPFGFAELGNRDERTGFGPAEHDRITCDDLHHSISKVGLPDQLGPVDRHDALRLFRSSRDELYAVTQLVSREPTQALLAQRKPIQSCTLCCSPLPCAVIVPRDEPNVADGLKRHSIAVILDDNRCIAPLDVVQDDPDSFCVGVVGVLDQLENSEPGRANQLVAEKLQNASPRPELQAQRRVAGFCSGTGHVLDPLPRILVEHTFGHRTEGIRLAGPGKKTVH